jgi:hypothetical protein
MQRISSTDVFDPWLPAEADAPADTVRTLSAWILATWVGVGMVILLPTLLIHLTPVPRNPAWVFALVVTTISGLRYAWIVADGRRRLYEVSFWVFTYVFLGIAPLVQMRTGQAPGTTPKLDAALQQPAAIVGIAGIVAFIVGLSLAGSRRTVARAPVVANGVDLRRTVVIAVFALLLDAYYISKVGLGSLFTSRDGLDLALNTAWADSADSALITGTTTMTLLVSFIGLVRCINQAKNREWPLLALTITVGLALAITVNPITQARYVFGTVALSVAALFGLFATARRFRIIAILWIVALIVVFPLADAFRYDAGGEFKSTSVLESLNSPDFDAFAQINNTVLYVDRHGTTKGEQAAGVLLFWVPRRLWAEKPRDTGILLAESRKYSFTILSAPIWAELYINGGWPVLLIGMVLLGFVVRSQDNRIEESLRRARAPSILACILPFYLTILLRGSLLQAMSYLLVILVCTVFVSRWERSSAK